VQLRDEALDHLGAALRFDRVNPQYHELAASIHAAAGRWSEAIASQRRVLQYRSGDAGRVGLARLLRAHGGARGAALAALARAIEIAPGFAPAHNERAMALVQAGRKQEGIEALRRAVSIEPDFLTAWRNLAKLLYLDHVVELQQEGGAGADPDAPRAAIERVLALDPADMEFAHLRDALNGTRVARPPDAFVEGFFDRFAEQFDERLVGELRYTGPEAARALLAPHLAGGLGLALDLGCGTGLSGAILREATARLVGVDLSSGMLAKARERGLYDELVHAEIGTTCRRLRRGASTSRSRSKCSSTWASSSACSFPAPRRSCPAACSPSAPRPSRKAITSCSRWGATRIPMRTCAWQRQSGPHARRNARDRDPHRGEPAGCGGAAPLPQAR
jgi:predicted TPR repeat methyltransferase